MVCNHLKRKTIQPIKEFHGADRADATPLLMFSCHSITQFLYFRSLQALNSRAKLIFEGIQEMQDENTEGTLKEFLKNEMNITEEPQFHKLHRMGKPAERQNVYLLKGSFTLSWSYTCVQSTLTSAPVSTTASNKDPCTSNPTVKAVGAHLPHCKTWATISGLGQSTTLLAPGFSISSPLGLVIDFFSTSIPLALASDILQ